MGCINSKFIAQAGNEVLKDFFDKGMLSKLFTILSAPSQCAPPIQNEQVKDYMKCQFLAGQQNVSEHILGLYVLIIFAFGILSYLALKKGKKIYFNHMERASNRVFNLQVQNAPNIVQKIQRKELVR